MASPGQRDYSTARLTRHALERFVERFGVDPGGGRGRPPGRPWPDPSAGRNPANEAVAVLAIHRGKVLVGDPQRLDLPDRPDLAAVRAPDARVRPVAPPPEARADAPEAHRARGRTPGA